MIILSKDKLSRASVGFNPVRMSYGYKRIRRRTVKNFRRRLKRLAIEYTEGATPYDKARSSIASWLGLARHANAFKLSCKLFLEQDAQNIGKRLMARAR